MCNKYGNKYGCDKDKSSANMEVIYDTISK